MSGVARDRRTGRGPDTPEPDDGASGADEVADDAEVELDEHGRPVSGAGSLAGIAPRALARLSDFVLEILVPGNVLVLLFAETSKDANGQTQIDSVPVWLFPILAGIVAAYEIGVVAWRSQTVGMLIGGMRIVDAQTGEPVGTQAAVRRAALPLLAFVVYLVAPVIGGLAYLAVYLSPLLDSTLRRGWHDRMADTLVIRTR